MRRSWQFISRLRNGRRASILLEYGLITAIFGGVLILCVQGFGTVLTNSYNTIGTTLQAQVTQV